MLDRQFKLETELEQVVSKLVQGKSYIYNICQCNIWIWVCLKVEIVQKCAKKHIKVILSLIIALV